MFYNLLYASITFYRVLCLFLWIWSFTVIVMTFWYVLWNELNFFKHFKLLFSNGIDHDPHIFHDLCLFPFPMFLSHTITWPREVIIILWSFRLWSIILWMHPTGGKGAWKPTKTCWVHCRLWLKVPATYLLITDWVHSKCTQFMRSTWNLWEHLYSIWNVKSICTLHLIPHNS